MGHILELSQPLSVYHAVYSEKTKLLHTTCFIGTPNQFSFFQKDKGHGKIMAR